MKYVVDGDPKTFNATQGSRDTKNVTIYSLAPLTLGLASVTERRPGCARSSTAAEPPRILIP